MTRARLLVALLTAFLIALAPAGAGQAASGGDPAATVAKKKPNCKKGNNKKKCRCPKGQTRKKNDKGYRCKKPKTDPVDPDPVVPDPVDPEPVDPDPVDPDPVPPPADPGAGKVRDDNALVSALQGAAFYKYYETGGGYGSDAYNFHAEAVPENPAVFKLTYCTYYVFQTTPDMNTYAGLWTVKEGYTHPSYPGAAFGILQLFRQGMPVDQMVEAPVGVMGNQAEIDTGNGSSYFEPGVFSFRPGQATNDCNTWNPENQ